MILIIVGVSYSLFMQVVESSEVQVVEGITLILSSNNVNGKIKCRKSVI